MFRSSVFGVSGFAAGLRGVFREPRDAGSS